MTRLLIWILNAPPRMRRAIALGLAGGVLVMTVGAGIFATNALSAMRFEVVEKREALGRLQAVAALATLIDEGPSEAVETSGEFLAGDSDALIQSALQARLGEIASANSVTVVSVGVAAEPPGGDPNFIGLRTNLSGSLEGIHGAILALETSKPFLFIREAKLRSTNVMADGALAAPVELFAELAFYGARKIPPGEGSDP